MFYRPAGMYYANNGFVESMGVLENDLEAEHIKAKQISKDMKKYAEVMSAMGGCCCK